MRATYEGGTIRVEARVVDVAGASVVAPSPSFTFRSPAGTQATYTTGLGTATVGLYRGAHLTADDGSAGEWAVRFATGGGDLDELLIHVLPSRVTAP